MLTKKLKITAGEILGSKLDGKVKNLSDIGIAQQRRWDYTDENGFWTEKGYRRATSKDYELLGAATKIRGNNAN